VGEHFVPIFQSHFEHRIGQGQNDLSLDLDGILFWQALRTLVWRLS